MLRRGPSQASTPSVDAAGGDDPLAGLAGHLGNELKVGVVVQQRESGALGGSGDQQIRDFSSPLASRGQESLDLTGPTQVFIRGLDKLEHGQVGHVLVPLPSVAAPVADLQVGDAGSADAPVVDQGVYDCPHRADSEATDDTGIDEVS